MFHKIALLFNCIILFIGVISYFVDYARKPAENHFNTDTDSKFGLQGLLLLFSYLVLFLCASFLFVLITTLVTEVKVGKSPVGNLVIAYKYSLSNLVTSSILTQACKLFSNKDKIIICYKGCRPFGMAYGAVIHGNTSEVNDDTKATLNEHGYNILETKQISNALYISCPTVPWLSYFGVWLALKIMYPKFYKYSKQNRLSAYPVLELYKKYSVTLMAPLSQQDYFVVPEAESTLNRSSSSLNLLMKSTISPTISPAPGDSKTRVASRDGELIQVTNANNNVIRLNGDKGTPIKASNGSLSKVDCAPGS